MNSPTGREVMTDSWWAGMQALEWLGIGWLVCDSDCQLLGANRIANRILKARDGLQLNSEGQLGPIWGPKKRLAEAIQRVAIASSAMEETENRAFVLINRAPGKQAFTLLVRSVDTTSTMSFGTVPIAVVLVLNPSLSAQGTESDLRQLYYFSERESRLATLLMDGRSLKHCCDELGISASTIRTHLKHMFKKTGVRRQSEMVALLLKSIGLLRLRESAVDICRQISNPLDGTLGGDLQPDKAFSAHALLDSRQ